MTTFSSSAATCYARGTSAKATQRLRARIFWLAATPLAVGETVAVRLAAAASRGTVALIDNAVDPGKLAANAASRVAQNHVGEIELVLAEPLAADTHATSPRTGRIVIEFEGRIAGGGLVLATDVEAAQRLNDWHALAERLNKELGALSPAERIAQFRGALTGRIVFTTSFGLEDQVLTQLIADAAREIDCVTLDTGRMFEETYQLWAETEERYRQRIRAIYPRNEDVEALVARQGINGFYESRAARLSCCHVRKVEPLNRALAGASGWITGLRADQSAYRGEMALVEIDAERGVLKLNPLFDRTREAVLAFASEHDVPLNPLHRKSYASIGCSPCTRPIAPGEDERAGRWWWELGKTECGLHSKPEDHSE